MKRITQRLSVGLLIATLILAGCSPVSMLISRAATSAAAQTVEKAAEAPVLSDAEPGALTQGSVLDELEATLSGIYDDVNPSVVSIQVTQRVPGSSGSLPGGGFRQGSGSGFVWDKDGYIVTNNHVVEDADDIDVRFSDGSTFPADLVGADRDSDLAVLKIDVPAARLQPVARADGAGIRVGQLAVAIGSPFGLENTMTVGFVSALGRSLPVDAETLGGPTYTIPDVIQTDAPINPGNSGGVLVNEAGEVIGVTSAIISPVQASAGIGFAIPVTIVNEVVPALIADGEYTHAWLGLSGTSLTPDIAEAMDLDANQRGALVIEVLEDSPSEAAGLRGSDDTTTVNGLELPVGGDIIIALEGVPVQTFDDLVAELAHHAAGERVALTILRDGKTQDVTVTLEARPASTAPEIPLPDETNAGPAWLGIMARTLTPALAAAMDLPEDQEGVLVGDVQPESPAETAGLRSSEEPVTIDGEETLVGGDVIVAWDGEPVTEMRQLQVLVLQAAPGDEVTLTVLRDGREVQLDVTLGIRTMP